MQEPSRSVGESRVIVLWEVRKGTVVLRARTPIYVRILKEGKLTFAENETLRIFAHGSDVQSAMRDFDSHVVHFHAYYVGLQEDQVVGEGSRLKKLFETFERVE